MTRLSIGLCALFLVATPVAGQERFANPQAAVEGLVAAARAGDRNRVLGIFGPHGRDIIDSGDQVADKNARENFLAFYDTANRIDQEGDDKVTLVIGREEWSFPIPLVRAGGSWQFDVAAGRQEILARRIGSNESNAIQACLAYVDAQNEYAAMDPQGTDIAAYAQVVVSHPGKKDGLYWPTKDGEAASPIGELIANATSEGYLPDGRGAPFRGYYYKILKGQGPAAQGGAYDYVVHGKRYKALIRNDRQTRPRIELAQPDPVARGQRLFHCPNVLRQWLQGFGRNVNVLPQVVGVKAYFAGTGQECGAPQILPGIPADFELRAAHAVEAKQNGLGVELPRLAGSIDRACSRFMARWKSN